MLANPLEALLNDGSGKFTVRTNDVISPMLTTVEAWGLVVADLTNDDFQDVYVSSRTGVDAFLPGDPEGMILVATKDILESSDYVVFPNPVVNGIYLQHPVDFNPSEIQIFSATGHLVDNPEIHNLEPAVSQIELTNKLVSGLYFLKLQNEEGAAVLLKVRME